MMLPYYNTQCASFSCFILVVFLFIASFSLFELERVLVNFGRLSLFVFSRFFSNSGSRQLSYGLINFARCQVLTSSFVVAFIQGNFTAASSNSYSGTDAKFELGKGLLTYLNREPSTIELLIPEFVMMGWALILIIFYLVYYFKVKSNSSHILWFFIKKGVLVLILAQVYCVYMVAVFYFYRRCLYFKGFVFDFYTFTIKFFLLALLLFAFVSIFAYFSSYQKSSIFEVPIIFFFLSFFLLFLCSCFNFFSLFICTEGITFCLATLIIYNYGYADAAYAGMKYLILGSLASGMFIFGSALIFGIAGTTNFFWLKNFFTAKFAACSTGSNFLKLSAHSAPSGVVVLGDLPLIGDIKAFSLGLGVALVFLILGLFFKLSVAPMHQWTLDIYPVITWGLLILFSLAVKLSFFSVTFRFVFYVLSSIEFLWSPLFGVCGFLSLFFGSFGGVLSTNFKEFLAYSSLAQIGFIVYGLLVLDVSAYTSVGLFFVYYIISMLIILMVLSFFDFSGSETVESQYARSAAFASSNGVLRNPGIGKSGFTDDENSQKSKKAFINPRSQIYSLNSLRYISSRPVFGAMLTISILNLAGIPPLPGFFAKFFVLMALISYGYYFYAALCLFFSLLSIFYYIKIVMLLWIDKFAVNSQIPIVTKPDSAISEEQPTGLEFVFGGIFAGASFMEYEKNRLVVILLFVLTYFSVASIIVLENFWIAILYIVAKGTFYYL